MKSINISIKQSFIGLSLFITVIVIVGIIGLQFIQQQQVQLTKEDCSSLNPETHYTFSRETDNTTWCLSNLSETPIHTHWSQDGSRMAYALQDKTNPYRQLGPRLGYIQVENLNWYLFNSDGSGHRRFSIPEPYTFSFSPDGQYADYLIHNNNGYGSSDRAIVKIEDDSLVCKYSVSNLWYYESEPPCNNIILKNGELWDIESKITRNACQYWVDMYGRFPHARKGECKKVFGDVKHSTQSIELECVGG